MKAMIGETAVQQNPISFYEILSRYLELTKPRITVMVLATTFVGFYLASADFPKIILLIDALIGTALVASGASALNMVLEWDADSRMRRTESRPIPSGRISVDQAYSFGMAISLFGIFYLWLFVNLLTSVLAVLTAGLYLYAYTPLKKSTRFCTLVGAIPGAIPPVMGWTAATSALSSEAWWLFGILFLWQLPHFYAIGWMYKEDYARGGFVVLPVIDSNGTRTSWEILSKTGALVALTLLPAMIGSAGPMYLLGALLSGIGFFAVGVRFARERSAAAARKLLLTSILYLPLILILMILEKAG